MQDPFGVIRYDCRYQKTISFIEFWRVLNYFQYKDDELLANIYNNMLQSRKISSFGQTAVVVLHNFPPNKFW